MGDTAKEESIENRICCKCKGIIYGNAVKAFGKKFHQEHFTCTSCDKPVKSEFRSHEGKPYCSECFANVFHPKCAGCDLIIFDTCVLGMGKTWHSECYVCGACKKSFPGGRFFKVNNIAYCEPCHWEKKLQYDTEPYDAGQSKEDKNSPKTAPTQHKTTITTTTSVNKSRTHEKKG